jgi:hypothetical protein
MARVTLFENLQRAVSPEVCLEAFRVPSDAELVAIRPKLTLRVRCLVGGSDHARSWSRCTAIVPVTHRARKVNPTEKAQPVEAGLNENRTTRRGGKRRRAVRAWYLSARGPQLQSICLIGAIRFLNAGGPSRTIMPTTRISSFRRSLRTSEAKTASDDVREMLGQCFWVPLARGE